jgi:hypothetical protein
MMLKASDIANTLHNARCWLIAYRTRRCVAIATVTYVSALPVSNYGIRRLDQLRSCGAYCVVRYLIAHPFSVVGYIQR